MKTKTLVWFRQDLRLKDNPALSYACENGDILPVYIVDNTNCEKPLGEASNWWLHHALTSLNDSLNNQLCVFIGDPVQLIPALVKENGIDTVVWNRCYQPWQIRRDTALKKQLTTSGIAAKSFNASLLWEPWDVLKNDGTAYKVYTPYYRRGCLNKPAPRYPIEKPDTLSLCHCVSEDRLTINALNLLPKVKWDSTIATRWEPGEKGAANNLQTFLSAPVREYKEQRHIPYRQGTSRLSPYLRFGEISPNQIWYAAVHQADDNIDADLDCYLSELGWREFSYYLLYHFPNLPTKNFNPKFDKFEWRQNEQHLMAWQLGKTGYPIVDAGMRELWQTGYMHNRVRMIVGSFLVKNLRLHWSAGEAWFWDCLLDADLASNSASWQWVAGTGADAAPYFRIFNPLTQGQKFDKQGNYVRQYCPELTKLPDKYIHTPWLAPQDILDYAQIKLGETYPHPIVDLKNSREAALTAFAALKQTLP